MAKDVNKQLLEPVADATGTVAAEEAPVAETAGTVAAEEEPVSKRDAFRNRVSKRYADLDMEDEDAYYDRMNGMMDEYEGYEKNSQRIRDNIDRSPAFAEMLLASREQEDFDPVVWMVENRGLDLEDAMNDPDYAQKIAKARQEYVAKESKGSELVTEMKRNLPETLEATKSALESAGLGDSFSQVTSDIYQLADDITHGRWSPELAVWIAKGKNYDTDVNEAHDAGMAEGLNKKVDDKLRTLRGRQERVAGVQTPSKPVAPKKEEKNMFMA